MIATPQPLDIIKALSTPTPADESIQWAYHRGGGQSGEPHETVYRLHNGSTVVLAGHRLGR